MVEEVVVKVFAAFGFPLICSMACWGQLSVLSVPQEIEVRSIDGQAVKLRGLFSRQEIFEIAAGTHEIVAYYETIYEDDSQDVVKFRSPDAVLSIEMLAGEAYRIKFDEPPEKILESGESRAVKMWVERFEPKPRQLKKAELIQLNHEPVPEPDMDSEPEPVQVGVVKPIKAPAPSTELTVPKPEHDPVAPPHAEPEQSPQPAASVKPTQVEPAPVEPPAEISTNQEMLRFWWEKSSAEDKARFLRWVDHSGN